MCVCEKEEVRHAMLTHRAERHAPRPNIACWPASTKHLVAKTASMEFCRRALHRSPANAKRTKSRRGANGWSITHGE